MAQACDTGAGGVERGPVDGTRPPGTPGLNRRRVWLLQGTPGRRARRADRRHARISRRRPKQTGAARFHARSISASLVHRSVTGCNAADDYGHRERERLFETGERPRVSPVRVESVARILARLDDAVAPSDMSLPGFGLHPLKGDLAGYWAVRVSGNWRIVFRFDDGDAKDVDLIRLSLNAEGTCHADEEPTPSRPVCASRLPGASGLSVTETARKLGVSRKQLSDVVDCRSGISPKIAIRLDKAFGGGVSVMLAERGSLPVQIADAVRFVVRNMRVSARKHPEREGIFQYSHVDIGPGLEWSVVLDGRSPQCPRSCCHAIVAFRLTHP